ncbi:O-antigen ligase family protein [Maribacter sp. X9]|uniref:O-antigen ligase family protein n=1 Tax=Maribacter sp. X9 TaxID=3402159 RepID=UPI003AF37174
MGKLKNCLDRLWFYLLFSLFLFPVFPTGIETVLIICFTLLSILKEIFYRKKGQITFKRFCLFLALSSIFFIYIIGFFFSTDSKVALGFITRVLPIVLFPIIFGLFKNNLINQQELKKLKLGYIVSTLIGLMYLNIDLSDILYFKETPYWNIRQSIESISKVHGTYLSLWIGFAILLMLDIIRKEIKSLQKGFMFLIICIIPYFFYWQSLIGARMPFAITIVLSIIYLILQFKSTTRIAMVCVTLVTALFFLKTTKSGVADRVQSVFNKNQTFPEGDYSVEYKNISSEDIRKGIFYCSWILIKESPLRGYGQGDVQSRLDACYKQKFSSNVYQKFLYNTHNQYLQIFLSAGIFALIFFLTSLFAPLYIAYKKSDFILFSFIILVMGCLMTENLINRHDGIIFYSLFNSILIFNIPKGNEEGVGT